MNFNREKYKVLYLGNRNVMQKYRIGDTWLNSSICEKDLGILVDKKLKMSQQCDMSDKKAALVVSGASFKLLCHWTWSSSQSLLQLAPEWLLDSLRT